MNFNENKLLFFDIETVGLYEKVSELKKNNPLLYKVWKGYEDHFQSRFKEKLSEDELWKQSAALFPEFGKVVCVSFGIFDGKKFKIDSYTSHKETEILTNLRNLFDKSGERGYQLCGQNIKIFDIPFLGKRYLINGLKPPIIFPTHDTKPWEIKVVDTKEIWNFGNMRGLCSLDLITTSLNIDSPKNGDIRGDSVHQSFWSGKLNEIKEYCEKDVHALMDIIKYYKNLK